MNLPCQNTCRHATSIHKALYRREAEGISVHMTSSVDSMKAMIFSVVSRSSSSTDNMNSFPTLSPPITSTDRPPFTYPVVLI